MFDLIGDIHGHAAKLEQLLEKLNYKKTNGTYSHPDRKVLFLGDYIDRGPQIRKTLEIVKAMVDSNNAIALMGNHEYNALCFHVEETEGGHLRKHLIKNIIQHYETIFQFQNKQKEYEEYIDWFKTLPLYFENEYIRAVHASWDEQNISFLRKKLVDDRLNDELLRESVKKGTELNEAIDQTLKGKEIYLPAGISFTDKDRNIRKQLRIKWWENPLNLTYRSIAVKNDQALPDIPIDKDYLKSAQFYNETDKTVFFGHYWLNGNPQIYRQNICCLDYSVAEKGKLVAYRFNGEKLLDNKQLVYV